MNATLKISRCAESGFTLIEMLMAVLILTVGLLGLLQSVNISYQHNLRNRLREEGVALAEEQLHTLMRYPSLEPLTTASRTIGGVKKQFVVARKTEPVAGDSNRLTVAVTWGFKNVSTTHEIYTIKKPE